MRDEEKSKSERFLPTTAKDLVPVLVGLTTLATFAVTTYTCLAPHREEPKTFGNCALKPQIPPKVKRLNGYLEEGQRYAANSRYDLAAHRFQQVIDADPNFLGAHQDLGVVQLRQRDFKGAQASFEAEIKLIDCLRSVRPSELHQFSYLLDRDQLNQQASNELYLDRLNKAEDTAHYNLACAFAKQGERTAALDELKDAAEHHSIKREMVAGDPDLRPVRQDAGYQAALARF